MFNSDNPRDRIFRNSKGDDSIFNEQSLFFIKLSYCRT